MTIYDEIGGADAVSAAVDDFYRRVLNDAALNGYFDDTDLKRLKSHQRSFISAAIGGPTPYLGRNMRDAHAHLRVTPEHFERVVGHLVDTLTDLDVPAPTIDAIGAKLAPLKDDIAAGSSERAG